MLLLFNFPPGDTLLSANSVQERKEKTYRHVPSKKTRKILKRRLRYEFELYRFIKARFNALYEGLIRRKKKN